MDPSQRPLVVDLFCKAGGAGVGYQRAGFDVVGVDIEEQPNYPFPFYRGDAFTLLERILARRKVALIHASPPCQHYSGLTNLSSRDRDSYPDLVEPTRELLKGTGLPYIIENVALAPLEHPTMLCGSMFDLGVEIDGEFRQLRRHRFFESNELLYSPCACQHTGHVVGVYGSPGGFDQRRGRKLGSVSQWRIAMGIDWMNADELAQSIPPVFTRFLGAQVMGSLTSTGR